MGGIEYQVKVLNRSMENGWTGLFELDKGSNRPEDKKRADESQTWGLGRTKRRLA